MGSSAPSAPNLKFDHDQGVFYDEDGEPEYIVERIEKKTFVEGKPKYLVKWVGYGPHHNTWEPLENLKNCERLVWAFENSKPKISPCPSVLKKGTMPRVQPSRTRKQVEADKMEVDSKNDKDKDANSGGAAAGNSDSSSGARDDPSSDDDDDDEEDKDLLESYQKFLSPLFCFKLKKSQIPICILGSNAEFGMKAHFVRLKPETEEEAEQVKADPHVGLTQKNSALVRSDFLNKNYPQLVIDYYYKHLKLERDPKTLDEKAHDAAKACLLRSLRVHGTDKQVKKLEEAIMKKEPRRSEDVVDAPKGNGGIKDDNMEVDENENHEPIGNEAKRLKTDEDDGVHPERVIYFCDSSSSESESGSSKKDQSAQTPSGKRLLDQFGLPDNYGTSSEDDVSSTSGSSDDEMLVS